MQSLILRLNADDNVAVVRRTLPAGAELNGDSIRLITRTPVPAGHKVALEEIAQGAPIRKYGQIIGFAKNRIGPGEHVHTHNVEIKDFGRDYQFCAAARALDSPAPEPAREFQGYLRRDGRVGTRNYLAIISSVNCSASVSKYVAERFRSADFRRDFPNVDGVIAFTHKSGCGIQPDEPTRLLQRVLAGVAKHPNVSGCAMIGLGCEVNQVQSIVHNHQLEPTGSGAPAPAVLTIQSAGGVRKTVEAGVAAIAKLLPAANELKRSPQPLSKLLLALKCGGSDANSGITANPSLGVASDALIRCGGTSVLAETPEIFGAEHLLTRRAVTPEVGQKLVSLIEWWQNHMRLHHTTLDNNPSFGNREGGLTTILEKSLGAVAKGGQSPLTAVCQYAEQVSGPGLCFMDTPGYDPVCMTGMVAGGCNVAVFTTGRGSVYGCKPTPSIKVATNTAMFNHLSEDMDINAGTILDGAETVAQVGARIFEKILAVASGEKTKSELAGMGDEEFAPWILGPTF
jgi:altronate dehydratase